MPTRSGPRLRLALAAGLLLAVVGPARADWQVRDLTGGPNDVEVWTPDIYSVATQQGAWLLSTDGGTRVDPSIAPGLSSVGTIYYPDTNCFGSFVGDGQLVSAPGGCVPVVNILPEIPGTLFRVKHTEAGNAYAWATSSEPQFAYGAGGARQPGTWALLPGAVNSTPSKALGVLSLPSGEHALFGTKPARLYWYRDQQLMALLPPPPDNSAPQAIDLVPTGAPNPTALVGTNSGLFRAPLIVGGSPFTNVSPPGVQGVFTSVDVNTGAGSAYGDGFGMALFNQDGGTVVLRSVPATRPEDYGRVWTVSTEQPVLDAPPAQLECFGAQLCVVTLERANTQNVAIYRNAHAPVVSAGPDNTVPEGQSRSFFVGADDDDGDPLAVTVERPDGGMPPDGGPPPLRVEASSADGGVLLQLTGLPVCEDTDVPVQVVASDGWRAHEVRRTLNFRVIHTGLGMPELPTNTLTVQAGGDAGVISVDETVRPRCGIDRYQWSALSPSAQSLEIDGGTATFRPPATLCDENGRSYVYRVQAIDQGGALSAPNDFTVQVRPWGVPSAAFGPDAGAGIDAGQTLTITPTAEHLCQLSSGYPGVETHWELSEGTLPAGYIQLATEDGGLVTGTSTVTPRLIVKTQECADAQLAFTVRHYPRDGSRVEGPASTFRVRVDPRWAPPSTGTLSLALEQDKVTAKTVVGQAAVEDLNCLAERGGVKARIRLERADGTTLRQQEFTVPGQWGFLLDDVCEPATTYNIVGELVDVSGSSAEPVPGRTRGGEGSLSSQALTQISVNVPTAALPLEPLTEPRITAQCGGPATGTLRQRLPEGPCGELPLVWEQVGGPPLARTTFSGPQFEVATQETDFGALIGQSVVLRVTASTVGVQREHRVPITAEPFVEVNRRTERSTGTEAELLGVAVELHNTTGCGVREVSHVERLEGADYVPGSARFNGAPVEAELVGSELTVRGLVLEGDGRGQLTYLVRPRLLGPQRFEGQSSLRGIAISQPREEPGSGCGCSGGGSGAAAMGLAGLLLVLSRRRRR